MEKVTRAHLAGLELFRDSADKVLPVHFALLLEDLIDEAKAAPYQCATGYMPIPTAEQLAEALENVGSFHDMSAELIAPELLANLLAALPQQDEPLYVTHRPLIRNAINLLGMRSPVAPDVQRVIDDLEAMLCGQSTPAGAPSEEWLHVAAVAGPAPAQDEREAFEVEIPSIVATFDGLCLIPVATLTSGEHLMTVAQHLRIEKQLRAALARPAQTSPQTEQSGLAEAAGAVIRASDWWAENEDSPKIALTHFARATDALRAALSAQQSAPERVSVPVDRIKVALEAVQNAMEDAYNNAYQNCCGRGIGQCCGNPEPAWSDADQAIMDALSPAQRELSAILASHGRGEA